MSHFTVTEWADFARGLGDEIQRTAMEEHLRSGCSLCSEAASLFARVAVVARLDLRVEVPAVLVQDAIDIFPARVIAPQPSLIERISAYLVFSSRNNLQLEGVRSTHAVSHQAAYEAGDYCVDVRTDREPGTVRSVLVGQIGNRLTPDLFIKSATVFLMSRKQVIAQAQSNEFGEFSLEYLPQPDLRMIVQIAGETRSVEIVLSELEESKE